MGFHTAQCYMIGRFCPKGLGVALNNDDAMPDGLHQAGFLLWVWILACTTLSACHYKLIEREIQWKYRFVFLLLPSVCQVSRWCPPSPTTQNLPSVTHCHLSGDHSCTDETKHRLCLMYTFTCWSVMWQERKFFIYKRQTINNLKQ